MSQELFAGIDVSTQSCKLVIIDLAQKEIPYVDLIHYDQDLPEFRTQNGVIPDLGKGISESDPRMWTKAVEQLFLKLKASQIPQENIRCISVSGQQHGLVAIDPKGKLARSRSKLWNDFSTSEECQLLTEAIGDVEAMVHEVGNSQRTGYTAAKILHMRRHEPENYHQATTFFLVHNYINWFLSGGVIAMEPGDTSGMALWNPATRQWSDAVIQVIDPELRFKLPEVTPSDETIGYISPSLALEYGLSPDCKIDAGSGDNMYGALGTGNIRPGIVTISLGTSGTAYTFLTEPFLDPEGEIASFCDSTGHYLPLLCVSNLSNGYNLFLEQHGISHAEFNALSKKTPVGNHGRVLIPWYDGERTPDIPLACPVYFGFELSDFTPEILARAVLEGHILNLYEGFRRMPVEPTEVRLTGGLSKSPAWCQAIADIFEANAVPVKGEGAALGAALHAAWVWQKEVGQPCALDEIVDAFVTVSEKHRKKPRANSQPAVRLLKRLFHAVCQRLLGQESEDPWAVHDLLAKLKSS